jgi:predicted porin
LTDAVQTTATLDASLLLSQDLSTYAYIGRERFKSRQSGSQDVLPAGPFDPDWFVQNKDTVDSLGVGFDWSADNRLQLRADYVLSRSKGETSMQSNNPRPPVNQFPDLKSTLHSLRLYADYRLRKNTHLQLSYQYEKYDADDWSIDGVAADTIPEVLLLGEGNPSYDQHAVGVSIAVKF